MRRKAAPDPTFTGGHRCGKAATPPRRGPLKPPTAAERRAKSIGSLDPDFARRSAAVGRGAAHLFKASWGPMNVRRGVLKGGRPVANEIGTPVPNTVNRRPQLFPPRGEGAGAKVVKTSAEAPSPSDFFVSLSTNSSRPARRASRFQHRFCRFCFRKFGKLIYCILLHMTILVLK